MMMNHAIEVPPTAETEERRDSYLRHSELLVDADSAEDPVERMLIVCRLLFSFCCDILRTSDKVTDVPIPTLGYHHIAREELGTCPGGNLRLHLQEICTFSSQTQAAALSHQKGVVRTTMTIALRPWARTKGMLLPGSKSVQICLEGGAVVQLDRYREEYTMTFPSLVIHSPLTEDSIADFAGQAGITCIESGLEAKLNFKANHAVKGVVQQITSKGSSMEMLLPDSLKTKVLHQLTGRWDKRITITNRNPEKPPLIEDQPGNLLFDAHQDQGNGCYINKRLDIGRLGPLQLPKLWSAFHDALMSIDPERSANTATARKLGVDLQSQLPLYYGLHFNEREQKRQTSDSEEEEEEEEEKIDLRMRLPPCIEEQKEGGGRLHYQLSYSVVFLTPDEMDEQVPVPFSPTQAQQLTQQQQREDELNSSKPSTSGHGEIVPAM
ncbi:hypothetical protein HOP50_02g11100 [Chloropicon primus]|uniref:Oxysterol-binding protein n=1 Tax=Chloropicon primus TaxID=1764295 RepID=A0A5B8MDG3_9CHLO|nr:hypothetical protein A3770_02p11240 [Chloropicon primus]UPQ97815.1 hypothetical protein HOP50_02g11100 [Chloropicon primus]|eukprot:QDZ18606.1 hypothetical protein A3770_02p11240 [Chloropicon primus]